MPCVRLPSHLHRSPYGVYHFRLVLPAALAEAAGTREIWRSLRTSACRAPTLRRRSGPAYSAEGFAAAVPTSESRRRCRRDGTVFS
ncbi:DUF6538 domain-containing protein [Burkholderia vietnamiensis]|uniref:DUF6538 domain-containing protein n=1 Tax=Burkholderia vietnamiensis TaxID=60552 RepID=UPI002ED3F830